MTTDRFPPPVTTIVRCPTCKAELHTTARSRAAFAIELAVSGWFVGRETAPDGTIGTRVRCARCHGGPR